ncbi:MAG: hypothetical protein KC996_11865 [Phycisphaerales bacterium]|nr:hypothetical protein [Phycisphaerales bacterium]
MKRPREEVISEARAGGSYRCAKCSYPLEGVPTDAGGRLTCPECGFAMRFVVVVKLVRGDDEQIRDRDQVLNQGDRVMLWIATAVLVILALVALMTFL